MKFFEFLKSFKLKQKERLSDTLSLVLSEIGDKRDTSKIIIKRKKESLEIHLHQKGEEKKSSHEIMSEPTGSPDKYQDPSKDNWNG